MKSNISSSPIVPQKSSTSAVRNRFESFEQFQEFIRLMFIEESGIDPEIFEACVEFHEDLEFDYGGEVSTPIHEELGWDFTRFGHQVKERMYAAFLKNEDGSVWQAIVSIWDEERQRPYRYIAPKGIGDRAFLPPVPPSIRKRISTRYAIQVPPTDSFWEWLEDIDIPRILTEGGKKSLCLFSLGHISIALYGCTCGAKTKDELGNEVKPYLINDLERFAAPDSKWLFALDRDENNKAKLSVGRGKKNLRLALGAQEAFSSDIVWKSEQGKGVDDFVVDNGSNAFDAVFMKAVMRLEKAFKAESVKAPACATSKSKQLLNLLEAEWGNRLRFNEMTIKPELDGKPINFDTLSIQIADQFDVDVSKERAADMVLFLSLKRSYHPVREYLERVATEYPNQDLSILDNIATRYFGTNEPLHNIMMRKHLIGAVRRIFEPGSQHDTTVVLQGKQGVQKSKFWRQLAVKPDWFDDSVTSGNNDKDDRLKLRRFWFLELAEIESVFKRKEIAGLRAFLTTKCDNLRVPYGRSVESFPRTSVFVGSVNPSEFLVDPEGHRRFWVIPVVVDLIPIEQLKQELDYLWAAAVHAYRQGERDWLTKEEENRNVLLNKRYEVDDSWEEVINAYLGNQTETSVVDILSNCLKIELGRQDRSSQMRVAECLKKLDWVKAEKKKINGKVIQRWKLLKSDNEIAITKVENDSNLDTASIRANNSQEIATQNSNRSNLDTASITDSGLLPFEQKELNFSKETNSIDRSSTSKGSSVSEQDAQKGSSVSEQDTQSQSSNLTTEVLTETESESVAAKIIISKESNLPQKDSQGQTLTETGLESVAAIADASKNMNQDSNQEKVKVGSSPLVTDLANKGLISSPTATTDEFVIGLDTLVDYCGECVTVVGWKNGGSQVEIQFLSGIRYMVKRKKLKPYKGDKGSNQGQ